jgi:hypothetical protein
MALAMGLIGMRDIREDLRERLAVIEGRYADAMVTFQQEVETLHKQHQETIIALERERAAIKVPRV